MSELTMLLQGPVARAIGWALLHLVWQATLIAVLLAITLAALRNRSANARYAAACVALALTLAVPLVTGVGAWRDAVAHDTVTPVGISELAELDAATLATPAPEAAKTKATSISDSIRAIPVEPALPWVVSIWLAGVTLLSARIALALVSARRLTDSGIDTLPREYRRNLDALVEQLGISRAVSILESTRVDVPTVIGWLSPVILVPASALGGLSPEQMRAIIAHELAHVRRHDFVVNLAQSLVETLLFYHPAVWWISSQVRIERELCCDDMAVELCGDAVGYARALTTLEELRSKGVAAPALAATGGSLVARVRRLLGAQPDEIDSTRPIAALIVVLVVAGVIAIPLSAKARQERQPAPKLAMTEIVIEGSATPEAAPAIAPEDVDSDVVNVWTEREVAAALAELNVLSGEIPPTPPAAPDAPAPPAVPSGIPVIAPAPPASPVARPAMPAPPAAPAPPALPEWRATVEAQRHALAALDANRAALDAAVLAARAPRAMIAFGEDNGKPVDANNPSIDDLVILRATGVDAEYIRELEAAGLKGLTARQLAMLRSIGVDGDYVGEMNNAFKAETLTVRQLITLRSLGVEADDVEELRERGMKVDVDGAIRMRSLGIDDDYLAEMKKAGFTNVDLRLAATLKRLGIDEAYIAELRNAGLKDLGTGDLIKLKAVGVDGDYVNDVTSAGWGKLSIDDIVRLRSVGIDGDYLREWKQKKK